MTMDTTGAVQPSAFIIGKRVQRVLSLSSIEKVAGMDINKWNLHFVDTDGNLYYLFTTSEAVVETVKTAQKTLKVFKATFIVAGITYQWIRIKSLKILK